jgi:hypothetical protein
MSPPGSWRFASGRSPAFANEARQRSTRSCDSSSTGNENHPSARQFSFHSPHDRCVSRAQQSLENIMERPSIFAYYFPSWHTDARNEGWFGKSWSEWSLLKAVRPSIRRPPPTARSGAWIFRRVRAAGVREADRAREAVRRRRVHLRLLLVRRRAIPGTRPRRGLPRGV